MPRTLVITGAASGIGAAVASLVRGEGHRVIGVDLADADVCADLATPEGRSAAVADVLELSGGVVDGLVTCAGLSVPSPVLPRVNYFGTTVLAAGLRSALAASSAPRVVVIGSISGTQPVDAALVEALLAGDEAEADRLSERALADGRANQLYPSSKAALATWARTTCVSPGWADAGITLNVVAPGVVLTPMSAGLVADPAMRKVMEQAVPMPLHGYAEPEDVARVIGFLVSPDLTHVTGQVLYVDGGAEATLRPAGHF